MDRAHNEKKQENSPTPDPTPSHDRTVAILQLTVTSHLPIRTCRQSSDGWAGAINLPQAHGVVRRPARQQGTVRGQLGLDVIRRRVVVSSEGAKRLQTASGIGVDGDVVLDSAHLRGEVGPMDVIQ